jgi:hypothetical protein
MIYKKAKFCATLVLSFCLVAGYAQETLNSSGGTAMGSGGSSPYALGQIFEANLSGYEITEIKNVQQPSEILSSELNNANSNIALTVYPNPTEDNLTLRVQNSDFGDLRYQLFDMQGNLLESKQVTGNENKIVTSYLPRASYFLKIMQNNIQVKSFKIVKF